MNTKNKIFLKSALNKSLLLMMALLILAGGLAFSAQDAEAATCTRYHTVKRGETLYLIGLKYGLTWDKLWDMNPHIKNPSKIYYGTKLCVSTKKTPPAPSYSGIPTFNIRSVVRNQTVTIRTNNFPAHDTFVVRMGAMGTRGVNGIKVATIDSGKGGAFNATFDIPASLKGSYRIAIRLESRYSGHFAYNWFYNNTAGTSTGTTPSGYTGIPTFRIRSVVRNQTVTIRTNNFPADDTFVVRMGAMGTRGINGIKVATINSDDGGAFTATFDVPASLKGSYRIAIRLESPYSGYFAYNWFYNNTTN